MTAKELLKKQIDDAGGQLSRAVEGVTSEQASYKVHEQAMSVTDSLTHLSEAYQAVVTNVAGGKYEWGSYTPPSTELGALKESTFALRNKATDAVLAGEGSLELGADYIVGHDYYHVGQLVTTRLATDPSWDAFSIYGG